MRTPWFRSGSTILNRLAPAAALVFVGCAARSGADDAAVTSGSVSIRFAIEVDGAATGPAYVLLNREDGQVGWLTVTRDGRRVYLQERCDIEDCGAPPSVCGAAIPLVRDLAGGGERSVEFVWDGTISVVDDVAGCETRGTAAPGAYAARLCYARDAELDGTGDPVRGMPGRLVRPTCEDRAFTLADREVVLGL